MNSAVAGNLIYKFLADTSNLDRATKSVNGGFKGMTKSMVVANLATKAISAGFNLIAQNSDRAIQRIDTFNAYPKVLKNFGVATEQANASIKRIDKSVQGLPTSLDEAVAGVQDLFMVTKDLPEAERLFKAVNDSAMVFANGSTEAVKHFNYAYKQAMAQGKVMAGDFNQMNQAIPGLMDKVAESMGITFAELKDGLAKGNISMEQFNNALKKLDTEGGAGMKALEQSAKTSTGGIATSITNAKTAVVRGVAELVNSVDKGLKGAGLGGIGKVVGDMGKAIESGLKAIAPYITEFIIKVKDTYTWIKKNQKIVKPLAVALLSLAGAFKVLLIISKFSKTIMTIAPIIVKLSGFIKFLIGVVQGLMVVLKALWVLITLNPITIIITAIVALVAIFVILWKKCEWFRNFWIGLWEGIKSIANTVVQWFSTLPQQIGTFIDNAITFLKKLPEYVGYAIGWMIGKLLIFFTQTLPSAVQTVRAWLINAFVTFVTQTIPNFINGIIDWFKELPGKIWTWLVKVVTKLGEWINNMKTKAKDGISKVKDKIIEGFRNLPNNLKNIGKNIVEGLWKGMKGMKQWVIDKVKSMGKGIIKGLKDALGIHSPSKEFALIGKFSVLGYTEALDKMRKDVQQQVGETFGISPQLQGSMNAHYSPNVNVTNNIDVSTDPLGQTVKKIKTFSGGAKNDYNYGMGV